MNKTLSAKEISNKSMMKLSPLIQLGGFKAYRAKKFISIKNNILFLIEVCPKKTDFYLWYMCYPLCIKNIWLESGVIGGRYPNESTKFKINSNNELDAAIESITIGLETIFKFFDNHSTLEKIEESITPDSNLYTLLVKGICLAALGNITKSRPYLEMFVSSGLRGQDVDDVRELLDTFEEGSASILLNKYKENNIKNLKLSGHL